MSKRLKYGDIVFGHKVIGRVAGSRNIMLEDEDGKIWYDQISNLRCALGQKHNRQLALENGANVDYKKDLANSKDPLEVKVKRKSGRLGVALNRDSSQYVMTATEDYDAPKARKVSKSDLKRSGGSGRRKAAGVDLKSMIVVRKYFESICGFELHVDHILPVAQGGSDDRSNLMIVPARFNSKKADHFFGEPVMCRHDFKMMCANKMFKGAALKRMEHELTVIRDMVRCLARDALASGYTNSFEDMVDYTLDVVVASDRF